MSYYISRRMLETDAHLATRGPVHETCRDPGSAGGGAFGSLRRACGAVARNWQRRRMVRALQAMDDWLLSDIGIYRGDIERVVNGFDRRELRMTPLALPAPRDDRADESAANCEALREAA